jgi:ribulose-phosphate 3-epimerase
MIYRIFCRMVLIAPSVLAADFRNLADEVSDAVSCGVDCLHMDIMDGHFVPNISYGPKFVDTVNKLTDTPLDIHLMLTNPEEFFDDFIEAGADTIIFHIEAHADPVKYLRTLRDKGCRTGLSLNPEHRLEDARPYLEYCDRLLVMSVHPGFSGQDFIPETLRTVEAARQHMERHSLNMLIAVDGGVDRGNARRVVDAGADILVMGSGFFSASDRADLVNFVHKLSANGPHSARR